jgi:hypothetical protein
MPSDMAYSFVQKRKYGNSVKGKSKAVPLHAMEAHGRRGGIAPTHTKPRPLDGGEWSASCPGRALPPGKGPPVPIG